MPLKLICISIISKSKTLVLLNPDVFFSENRADPDQLASEEAIRSGSTLFSTLMDKMFNLSKEHELELRPKKENDLFSVTLPTLIFWGLLKLF